MEKEEKAPSEFPSSDFPLDANDNNFTQLIALGHKIQSSKSKYSNLKWQLILAVRFGYFYILFMIGFASTIITAITFIYPQFAPNIQVTTFVYWVIIVLLLFAYTYTYKITAFLFQKLKATDPRLEIFNILSLVAEKISLGKREETNTFLFDLDKSFERYLVLISSRKLRKIIGSKINELRYDKIYSVILFDDSTALPYLLLDLGLSIIHNDFPKLNNITYKICTKREICRNIGGFSSILRNIETHIGLLQIIVSIFLTLLAIIITFMFGVKI